MGAMLVRHLLCHLHEQFGDGTATAAVLLQSVHNQGVHYLASGGNAMRLRHYLEEGVQVILDELTSMTLHVEGRGQLAQIAQSICYDPPLAKMLGEIFDIIGEYGQLEIETIRGRELKREYTDGMFWASAGLFSREMMTDHTRKLAEMENVAILISDLEIEDPRQLLPVMTMAAEAEIRSLLIVSNKLSTSAISLLVTNRDPEKFRETLENVKVQDLGRARRVWADRSRFGIVGGEGDPHALRRHMMSLRTLFGQTQDPEVRRKLQQRIGKLMGGVATLQVGGGSQMEIETRKELAEQAAGALRGAIREGVLPGGGVALLDCRGVLEGLRDQSTDPDERAAYHIMTRVMEIPARAICGNAGYDDSEVLAQIKLAGPGYGFDVVSGQVANLAQEGIFDVATVQKAAVNGAVTTAAMALTIDVLVHHKEPEEVLGGT